MRTCIFEICPLFEKIDYELYQYNPNYEEGGVRWNHSPLELQPAKAKNRENSEVRLSQHRPIGVCDCVCTSYPSYLHNQCLLVTSQQRIDTVHTVLSFSQKIVSANPTQQS